MSTSGPGRVTVRQFNLRSQGRSFALPRRLISYALGAELAMLAIGRLPLVSALFAKANWELRFLLVPLGLAYLLAGWKIDGRPADVAFRSLLAMRLRPPRLVAWRAAPLPPGPVLLSAVTIAPDHRGARLRPAVISGPAHLRIRYPFKWRHRWRTVRVEPQPGPPRRRGREISVDSGQRVVIR